MVDYQDYQRWASIAIVFQAIFTLILLILTYQYLKATQKYATATDKYVTTTEKILEETANYAQTTEEMLKASIIERQIRFYEKRLEKLYMPIYNYQNFFDHLPNAFNELEASGINNFIEDIKPYSYLANDTLRPNLEKLLHECGTLYPEEAEAKKRSGTVQYFSYE